MRWFRSLMCRLIQMAAHNRFLLFMLRELNQPPSYEPMGEFVDSDQVRHALLKGYRDRMAPNWKKMFQPLPDPPVVTEDEVAAARDAAGKMEVFINKRGVSFKGATVLEIGCYGGGHAYALAELGAARVDGIDIPEYRIRETPGKAMTAENLSIQSSWMTRLRETWADRFSQRCGQEVVDRVSFADMDAAQLDRADNYDIVVSWQTLEHLIDLPRALQNMAAALHPGGVMVHEYNPFFGEDGGHSLCTLDFPWGHVRLSAKDFERYIRTYRVDELDVAMNFFSGNLNRVTLEVFRRYSLEAGLEILEMIPWVERGRFDAVDETLLAQGRRHTPGLTVLDLSSSSVLAILKRPSPLESTGEDAKLETFTE